MDLIVSFPDDHKYWESVFIRGLNKHDSWVQTANDLILAMNIIRIPLIEFWKSLIETPNNVKREYFVHGVYLMLSAYAIENLFKAIIVKTKNWPDENLTKSIPQELKTHDLIKLAELSGLNFTDRGKELLMRQSEYAIWAARYPAPIKRDFLLPQQLPTGIKNTLLYWQGSDVRDIDIIINILKNKIDPENNPIDETKFKKVELELWESIVLCERITPWNESVSCKVVTEEDETTCFN